MAKSKSGGTRSYIRGRVGADVYSIGKDAQGKKQQVVRSLAESVANPQTQSQMRGRMIMSTVMQAVAALKPIIDHSFDNVTGRQPNISEFISLNYAKVKADVLAHPSSGNAFGLNKYQEKGVKRGAYIIADGDAQLPSTLVLTKASGIIAITMAADAVTIAGLKSALGMTSEEYFTLVGITADGKANYERFRVNPTLPDNTAISSSNIGDVFAVEGNAAATVSVASNVISITLNSVANCCAVIISKKVSGGYVHNEAVLGSIAGADFNADAALPTYPVGAQDYLNGGDIFGQQESFNPGGGDTPTPSPTQRSITAATVNGVSLSAAGSTNLAEGANSIVATIPSTDDEDTYTVGIADKATYTVGHAAPSSGMQNVSGTSATMSVNATTSDAAKTIVLCKNGVVLQAYGTLLAPNAPAPTGRAISGATVNSNSLASNGSATLVEGSNSVVVTVPETTDTSTYSVGVAEKATYTVGHAAPASGLVNVSGTTAQIVVTAAPSDAVKTIVLCKDGSVIQVWGSLNAPNAQPTPGSFKVVVNGTEYAQGSTINVDNKNINVSIEVPEGDPSIGETLLLSHEGYTGDSTNMGTIAAGTKTVNMNYNWGGSNDIYVGYGYHDDFQGTTWKGEWFHLVYTGS